MSSIATSRSTAASMSFMVLSLGTLLAVYDSASELFAHCAANRLHPWAVGMACFDCCIEVITTVQYKALGRHASCFESSKHLLVVFDYRRYVIASVCEQKRCLAFPNLMQRACRYWI